MEMFLTLLFMSLLGVALAAMSFGAATRDETREVAAAPEARTADAMTVALGAPQFFATGTAVPPQRPVSLDVLLLQIERHVRLEQAAAESFINQPSSRSLHSRTTSPLAN
jgi:hypothetical protein